MLAVRGLASHDSIESGGFKRAAVNHGELRYAQGYSGRCKTICALDFSLLLPDVMTIADEVDAQLTQTMGSYTRLAKVAKRKKSTAA
jgi:hypothetical protein